MVGKFADRVKEFTTSLGTGPISLGGAYQGFQGFVDAYGDGNKAYYGVVSANGAWEIGEGTVTDGTPDTLSRDTVLSSSNGGAKITLNGTSVVFSTFPAATINLGNRMLDAVIDGATVQNTTAETTVYSYNVPANTFDLAGKNAIDFSFLYEMGNNDSGSDTSVIIRLKYGTTTIAQWTDSNFITIPGVSKSYAYEFRGKIFPTATDVLHCHLDHKAGSIQDPVADFYSESNQNIERDLYAGASLAFGQAFIGNGGDLLNARFFISKTGSPTGTGVAKLYASTGDFGLNAKPTGVALATSDTIDVSTLSTSLELKTFNFSTPYTMVDGTVYIIVFEYTGGDVSNHVNIGVDSSVPTHPGNGCQYVTSWGAFTSQAIIFYVITDVGNGSIGAAPLIRGNEGYDKADNIIVSAINEAYDVDKDFSITVQFGAAHANIYLNPIRSELSLKQEQ